MDDSRASAFAFEGRWREYAPIAFTNLLLTIVTLGIYRFWATTRTRTYLWQRTRFIDETLEWTGTGKELLIGFLLAFAFFALPFLLLQFLVQALALRGHAGMAGALSFAAFVLIVVLTGIARFRALRYRLSRTYWHGIRGGSDKAGVGYGISWMAKSAIGVMFLWLLTPWAMMSLWNERWRQMSFGSQTFEAAGRAAPIYARFLLFYLAPFLIAIIGFAIAWNVGFSSIDAGRLSMTMVMSFVLFALGIYLLLGLIAIAYYAAFLREAIGGLSLGEVRFRFEASTRAWLMLFLVDVLLVVGTLGIGAIFLTYRHWKFFITHLEATGDISLSALGQSTTRQPRQGEGLLDAFDIGAI